MPPSIPAQLRSLRDAGEDEAERTIDALSAHGDDLWPALRELIPQVRGDNSDMTWLLRLQRVYLALPAPLDAQLLFASTAKQWAAARFVDILFFERVEEVAASSLRLLGSEDATEREVALSLLHRLVPQTGTMRYNAFDTEVVLDASAEPILVAALRRGEDPYVIAQILIRHGWAVEEALAALHDAVEDQMRRDQHDPPEGAEGLSYDLGCDLQIVATTFLHAGDAARAHIDLLDQMYEVGDAPLRCVVLESITGIGGEVALACVRRRIENSSQYLARLEASHPSYAIGFLLHLDIALALLEGRPGPAIMAELFPRVHASIFAGQAFQRFFPRIHASDPEGVETFLRQAARSEGEELGRSAALFLEMLA